MHTSLLFPQIFFKNRREIQGEFQLNTPAFPFCLTQRLDGSWLRLCIPKGSGWLPVPPQCCPSLLPSLQTVQFSSLCAHRQGLQHKSLLQGAVVRVEGELTAEAGGEWEE